MNNLLLPEKVSSDGREVWAWAGRMSNEIHRRAKVIQLNDSIRDLSPRCGTCFLWMKSRECPREKPNMTGYRQGPSMNGVACEKFTETEWVTKLREERKAELATILPKQPQPGE